MEHIVMEAEGIGTHWCIVARPDPNLVTKKHIYRVTVVSGGSGVMEQLVVPMTEKGWLEAASFVTDAIGREIAAEGWD